MKVDDMICVADFYDLCPKQVRDFVQCVIKFGFNRNISQKNYFECLRIF